MTPEIRLKGPGRKIVRLRHPWVYRHHLASGGAEAGDVVRVVDQEGRQVGFAAWSGDSRIALRFLKFGEYVNPPTEDDLHDAFRRAVERRRPLAAVTDAVRLVSSEADDLPGVIVDRFNDVVVIQALTPFAERLTSALVAWIRDAIDPRAIIARNDGKVRALEGLPLRVESLFGDPDVTTVIREGELRFGVDPAAGQKTGFFLDQRANRIRLGELVPEGARVLDVFTYVGGFALHAARRAGSVLAIDDSDSAVAAARANAELNQLANVEFARANAFLRLRELVKEGERFDVVVLDPPAFAKRRTEVAAAARGYREVNSRALRLVREGGLFVTASCSYHFDENQFEETLRRAAADASREVTLLERRGQDVDHPVRLSVPESRYLKCYFMRVE